MIILNKLRKYFDVELVVAYKLSDEVLYDIDKDVKVKYLIHNDIALRVNKYKDNIRKRDIKLLFKNIYKDYIKSKRIKHLFMDIYDFKSNLLLSFI